MKFNTTITIGIPAFNEEANIGFLLDDLVSQVCDNCIIDKIIVNSDGSTDKTSEIIKNKKYANVLLIDNKVNLGHPHRQNEIIDICESEILILLNADIKITDIKFIKRLIDPIINERAELTSCPIVPLKPSSLIEKSIELSMVIKNDIFESINHSDNVYTCHGPARAFHKKLYKKISFKDGPGEDAYTYMYTKQLGFRYEYVKNTEVVYKLPDNYKDYRKQNLRFIKSKALMKSHFGDSLTNKSYSINFLNTFKTILKYAIKHPVLSLTYILINVLSSLEYNFLPNPLSRDLAVSSKILRNTDEKYY